MAYFTTTTYNSNSQVYCDTFTSFYLSSSISALRQIKYMANFPLLYIIFVIATFVYKS